MSKKAIVVLSGGMDSGTLLYHVLSKGYEVKAFSVNYGQRHEKELEYAKKMCVKLNVPHTVFSLPLSEIARGSSLTSDIPVPHGHYEEESMKQTIVPNRNMVLIALAASYAISEKAEKVFYGAHAGDHAIYPDCRPEFAQKLGEALKICDWFSVTLEAPFINLTKGEIARMGKELGADYSLMWTCYEGKETPCGKCGSCVERAEAFSFAGMEDPLLQM
ncbi:MAG: 7-cyano-7-deazaguanine synthase QueC [Candidatus Paceibacterota bacterium]